MEVGLRERSRKGIYIHVNVSILVLMEVGLRALTFKLNSFISFCFNPCFNGSWSESLFQPQLHPYKPVSILVLMEVGLREWEVINDLIKDVSFQSLF